MRILGLVLAAVALLAAGCTSGSADKPDPKPTTHTTPEKPIDPSKAAVLELGKDLPLVAKLPIRIGKSKANFIGVASSNVMFGTLSGTTKGQGATAQSHPFVYNIHSKSAIRLDAGLQRPARTRILDVISSGATIIWAESPEVPVAGGGIAIYAYDRTSRARRQRELNPLPADGLSYRSDLTAVASQVLFSVAPDDKTATKGAAIYSGPVDGGSSLKVMVEDGKELTVNGDQMTYSVGAKKYVRDLTSGDTKPAPVSSHAKDATFCGYESVSVFTVRCEGTHDAVLTVTGPKGRDIKVGPFAGTPPNDLRLVGPWLDIAATDGRVRGQEYLLSPASKKLEALPKGTSLITTPSAELAPGLALLSGTGKDEHQWLVRIPTI